MRTRCLARKNGHNQKHVRHLSYIKKGEEEAFSDVSTVGELTTPR